MGRSVIFVDGEYVRKIFDAEGLRTNVPKIIDNVLKLCNIDQNDLLRVYYYTSPPYQCSNPTSDEKQRYKAFQKFENFLKKPIPFGTIIARLSG